MATYSYTKKYITSLTLENGTTIFDHDQKVAAIWLSDKDRLGVSEFSDILYDLFELIQAVDLPVLDDPFSQEEIISVLKDMPSDHALGPDGFNGAFFKKCWDIIKVDILRLCADFVQGNLNLDNINNCLIALIPKKDNPETVSDYKPISLLNYSLKFLTKLLANRLQLVILKVVHENQYSFIKGRTIQDCLAWTFQFLHICHKSKKDIVLIKLDFEKAFDKIEHEVIL
jgi:hypothetical protein